MLFICDGNVCRSPAAELLTRQQLSSGADPSATVSSAGLRAQVDMRIEPRIATLLAALDIDGGDHRAQEATEHLLAGADLVLTMTREQRSAVVDRVPHRVQRVFTLRELAAIVGRIPPAVLEGSDKAVLDWVTAYRGAVVSRLDRASLDVPDPLVTRGITVERAFDLIHESVTSTSPLLHRLTAPARIAPKPVAATQRERRSSVRDTPLSVRTTGGSTKEQGSRRTPHNRADGG